MTKLEPRVFKHTILQGEDDERLRELRKAAARLETDQPPTHSSRVALLAEDDPQGAYEAACSAADDFAAEAAERGVTVILRAIGRKKWAELVKEFPPDESKADEVAVGVAVLPFTEALLMACLSSPALSDDERQEFLDEISPADYDVLQGGAWALHKKVGADPKERLLSAPTGS